LPEKNNTFTLRSPIYKAQHTMQADLTGTVQALYQFPIKGGAGNRITQSVTTEVGLQYDRQWLFVDETGRFITQRQIPHLVWVQAQASHAGLILNAPNQAELYVPWVQASGHNTVSVQIWRDTVTAIDCGEAAAKWINQFLDVPGKSFRLVQAHLSHPRLADLSGTALAPAPNLFSDGYGINILSDSSITNLNDRLVQGGHEPIDALRFRPNIVLAGLEAHEEDFIEQLTIYTSTSPVVIDMVKPCTRCAIPNIDPFTAISSPEVNDTLAAYRRLASMNGEICFAMNAVVASGAGAVIKTGDPFEAQLRFN
jgi:hypothetical protein